MSKRQLSNEEAEKRTNWFVSSAGWILLITGGAKLISAFGHAKILDASDPILGVSFRWLMLMGGAAEILISGTCLLTIKYYRLKLVSVMWIAAIFLIYHFELYYIHWHRPCPCLGNLTDILRIRPDIANLLLTVIAAFLFLGSAFYWISLKKMIKSGNGLKLFSFIILSFLTSQSAIASDKAVILSGYYEYNVYMGRPTPGYMTTQYFTVVLDGCSWIISYTNASAVTKSTSDLMTAACCDGTNLYIVHYPSAPAQIAPAGYPYSVDTHLRNLWLAFASRCILDNPHGITKLPSCGDIGIYARSNYTCKYQWIIKSDGTPDKLIFFDDGTYWARDPLTGEVVHRQYPDAYANGFTLAVGDWLAATNVAGTSVPVNFQYVAFGPKADGTNAEDLLKLSTFRCVVTNVAIGDMPPMPVKLHANTLVYDRRFVDEGYAFVTYVVTNQTWPSMNNGGLRQALVHAPKLSPDEEAMSGLGIKQVGDKISPLQKNNRRRIARWIMLFALAVPAIYFCIRLIKNKAKPQ